MNRSFLTNPYVLVAPGFFLAAFIILWPLLQLGQISLSEVNRFGQLKGFAGLENYVAVFTDPQFLSALARTGIWTFGIVAGTIILSVPVALVLNEDFYGRGLARIIVMLPWAVSLTMTAIVWRWALNGESGMLNSALRGLGLIDQNVQWLAQAATAFPVQIVIGILVSIPFTVTIFLGGLSSIPDDLYEAAKLEGASNWQMFSRITLPLLGPFLNIAVVMNTINVFNSFPIIWATTQGGPANSTDILVTYLYKLGFNFGKLGEASALSLMMFALLLLFTIIYVRLAMRGERA
ncbi:sugar ABC transporter permease [Pseudaminobacter sp. 19-2017]|uniref:Sugar ABC transporter permease n=1 Tax=Pseudaminobacter soli (ex Zhang et al. 2022) TaxID=2831468 RepID=A0A942DZJ1_9HYPH|nr:sugar ABC transporter permease [Pseudaminobacter soli]MBS3650308.1 sugar ABC transporter permease [Pseudaminobacter soli]